MFLYLKAYIKINQILIKKGEPLPAQTFLYTQAMAPVFWDAMFLVSGSELDP